MKKFIVFILFFFVASFSIAQDTPQKELIYTLKPTERVATFENTLGVYQSRLGYMVVVEDQDKNTRQYLVNQQSYGPYDRATIEPPKMNNYHWGFTDAYKDSNIVAFDGYKFNRYPSFQHTSDLRITKNLSAYTIYNETLAEHKLTVNGVKYGPYANLVDYYLSPEGTTWAIEYFENVGTHYNFYIKFSSGKVIGPFSKIHEFALMNEDAWIVVADKKDTPSKSVGDRMVEQFHIITSRGDLGLFEKELVGQVYSPYRKLLYTKLNYGMNVIRNQQIFYMVNGELFGPYKEFVKQADLGVKPNRFNYVVGKDYTLFFRGEKSFAKHVRKFTVSDSRNSVAIVKSHPGTSIDTLTINDKYFVGVYSGIANITFVPETENFYFWIANNDGSYTLHTYVNNKVTEQQSYPITPQKGKMPEVAFSPSMQHWGFVYYNGSERKVVVDNQEYPSGLIDEVDFYEENGKEYAFWLSLDSLKDIVLNRIGF